MYCWCNNVQARELLQLIKRIEELRVVGVDSLIEYLRYTRCGGEKLASSCTACDGKYASEHNVMHPQGRSCTRNFPWQIAEAFVQQGAENAAGGEGRHRCQRVPRVDKLRGPQFRVVCKSERSKNHSAHRRSEANELVDGVLGRLGIESGEAAKQARFHQLRQHRVQQPLSDAEGQDSSECMPTPLDPLKKATEQWKAALGPTVVVA